MGAKKMAGLIDQPNRPRAGESLPEFYFNIGSRQRIVEPVLSGILNAAHKPLRTIALGQSFHRNPGRKSRERSELKYAPHLGFNV
jgi:hypothetical protein